MLRYLLWRLLGLLAVALGIELIGWFLAGGPGALLRGADSPERHRLLSIPPSALARTLSALRSCVPAAAGMPAAALLAVAAIVLAGLALLRWRARSGRCYARLQVEPYRSDQAGAEAVVAMFEALHKRLLRRWWRRLFWGQPTVALEVHHAAVAPAGAWLALTCPHELQPTVEAALRTAYPNCRLRPYDRPLRPPAVVLRLKKQHEFIRRAKQLDRFEQEREPPINRLLTMLGALAQPAFVQLALTPAPACFEQLARWLHKRREARLGREGRARPPGGGRSLIDDAELRGGLTVAHRPLYFVDLRIGGAERGVCEQIASELRAGEAENRLVERGTTLRHGLLGLYGKRLQRGEGNPLPGLLRGVFASTELAALWQLPSSDYASVPFLRAALPLAPAPPAIFRPPDGQGTLRDALGAISIHPEMRRQNTAVPGTVEQGKSSYLVATVAEDLRRPRCALVVLDPKGDAADAALSLVPDSRTCTLLDFAHPTCGFNPLAVDAPADVIADYVVTALRNLFTDADIRASSDRYLRNAIIAVLAHDRRSTLWDAARLLSVGEEGYAYRRSVGARVRTLPEFKEISEFFTAELTAQLADARSTTTAKLDAPVNKLARLLNSASIKRVLLNDSLRIDLDTVIAREQVLVVKGALGAMGAGNTAVLMQLLVGMLDASLARQQDLLDAERRVAVALKVDEAPLVLNRGFAETMALKRSAGLETVACWQTDAQWLDREVRDQLDALFAHRVYFATASARDARAAAALTMAEYSDTVRPGIRQLAALGHPDVRLHLPKHHAIASWTTPAGRQAPFIARTIPLRVDRERLARHAARQRERGGRARGDLRQPHWDSAAATAAQVRPAAAAHRAPAHATAPHQRSGGLHQGPSRYEQRPLQPRLPALPAEATASYRELVELDRAGSVRSIGARTQPRAAEPDRLDLEILVLLAQLGHLLTSQIHRRFNPTRAATTTQRRLKRLADAGLLARLQFHRRDGGGVPMCCSIAPAGLRLLDEHERLPTRAQELRSSGAPAIGLRQARHEIHVAGWVLALARVASVSTLRGAREAALSPPLRGAQDGRVALGPVDLRLPGGRTPHDFLRSDATGARQEIERFETIRPDAIVQAGGVDVLVERDDRLAEGRAAAKLERYDHFLTGWATHTSRYGSRREAVPMVAFVCRDRTRARTCACRADRLLTACRAYAGEYPFEWEYSGREQIVFVAERDVHEGLLWAHGVPRLPPEVRVAAARGDPCAAAATVEARPLLPQASGA